MKITVEKEKESVKAIKIEYTPVEALIINNAMRRYACDEEINATDREIMEQMLEAKPIFVDIAEKVSDAVELLRELPSAKPKEPKTDVLDKIRAEIIEKENALDCAKVSDVALKTAYIEVLKIIDKYRQEG